MKKLLFFSLVSLFCFSFLPAQSRAALEKEIVALEGQLEKLELQYWEFKQKSFKARQRLKEELETSDSTLRTLLDKKLNLAEEAFLVEENVNKAEEKLAAFQAEEQAFRLGAISLLEKESVQLKSGFPYLLPKNLPVLTQLSEAAPTLPMARLLEALLSYKLALIRESEEGEFFLQQALTTKEKASQTVRALRLGFIHSSYVADSETVGFLLRKGIAVDALGAGAAGEGGIRYAWHTQWPAEKIRAIASGVNESFNLTQSAAPGAATLVGVPIDVSQAGVRLYSLAQEAAGNVFVALYRYFQSGGVVMYPLLLLLCGALFIALERFFFFRATSPKKMSFRADALKALEQGKMQQLASLLDRNKHGFASLLNFLLFSEAPTKTPKHYRTKVDFENALWESFSFFAAKLEKRLSTLAVFATVAPLLGLLGTVTGMIKLFDVITLFGTSNPRLLASGISVALITTQTGLVIAVPLLLLHHFLTKTKNRLVQLYQAECLLLLERFPFQAAPPHPPSIPSLPTAPEEKTPPVFIAEN